MRADIEDLLKAYIERCKIALNAEEALKPFEWFKVIWRERKWHLLHLRCIQPRPRKAFLEVTFRLFLGIFRTCFIESLQKLTDYQKGWWRQSLFSIDLPRCLQSTLSSLRSRKLKEVTYIECRTYHFQLVKQHIP